MDARPGERRCPRCGGLVGRDVEWCGQCFLRLDQPPEARGQMDDEPAVTSNRAPEPDPDPTSRDRPIKVEEGRAMWACPTCGTENGLDQDVCTTCGFQFARLFEDPQPAPRVSAGRAAALSLVLPGLGHLVAGRIAEGLARLVVFAYALGTALLVLLGRETPIAGPLVPLGWLSMGAAAGLYVVTAVDAGRAAEGSDPLLRNRALLYGAIGLMLLTVVVLVVSGLRLGAAR